MMSNRWRDKTVLLLGLGESGLAMARWLEREGAALRVADSRPNPPGAESLMRALPDAHCSFGPFAPSLLDGVDAIAISPGLDPRMALLAEARNRAIPVTGEMSLLAQALTDLGVRRQCHVLAITGTNGKTTTTALAGAMCAAAGKRTAVAGNISPAALDVLVDTLERGDALPEVWVLELSSFQIETMHGLEPDAAAVLNVSDDHLDRYTDLAHYAQTKAGIFEGDGVMVLNRQDARVLAMQRSERRSVFFGADAPRSEAEFGLAEDDGDCWLALAGHAPVASAGLALAGRHNLANALAAVALCRAIGLPYAPLVDALRAFRGLPHRVERIAQRDDGVPFYDDSKGTNVGATVAALDGLQCKVVLIAGGDGKGQDFAPLRDAFARFARAVVLIGRDAPLIERAVDGCGVELIRAETMADAVLRANAAALAGDAVLLSPACASFDMFRSYAHRAEMFAEAVAALPGVTRS